MLRRQPTTLAVTAEDIAAYEDRKAREAEAERKKGQGQGQGHDAEMAGAEAGLARGKTREERIGVSRRRGR